MLLPIASLYNVILLVPELKNKLNTTPSNLEKLVTERQKADSRKCPDTLLQVLPLLLSLQVCSFVKSSTWKILLLVRTVRCVWPLLQNACSQIHTVSLPSRCVSMHIKSRESYSNRLNWDAFQGLRVIGQCNLTWFDISKNMFVCLFFTKKFTCIEVQEENM